MGKNSNFKRIPQDRYYTPFRPVVPLIPFLARDRVTEFAEPCVGAGNLVRHLSYFGVSCTYENDLDRGQDALTDPNLDLAQTIITNPPYTWAVMQPLIQRFMRICPTWLLLEADFAFNGQSADLLRHCSDMVPVGRVRWFEGTKDESQKHYAWFRFDIGHTAYPRSHPRIPVPRGIRTAEEHAAWRPTPTRRKQAA